MSAKAPSIHLLSDGTLKYDGGSIFGQIPKFLWEQHMKPDRWNRVSLGLNCLLIRTANGNVLVDTGAGTKDTGKQREVFGLSSSKLNRSLKEVGLTAKDIDRVILTHLHFDHSGGCTKVERSGRVVPAFPRATYVVQKGCWEYAMEPGERGRDAHHSEDYACLQESGQLSLVDGDCEILPDVWVKDTGGHCRGHQVVHVNCGGEKVVFLGDLIPTTHHLSLPYVSALDQFPEETVEIKRELIAKAVKDGWLVIFSHGNGDRAGYVEERDGMVNLRPVNL